MLVNIVFALGLLTGASVLSLLQVAFCCYQFVLPQKKIEKRHKDEPNGNSRDRVNLKGSHA